MEILIVDDDHIILTLHRLLIQKCGLSTSPSCYTNGMEVIEHLKKTDDSTPVLILLDINMPVMNGWELLDFMRAADDFDNVYVIMVTSSVDNADKEKSNTYKHVIDYVEKPVNKNVLEQIKTIPAISTFFE